MRQKLGLCCSLIHDPELLILDEPTTGVDPLSRRRFWELIEWIRSRRRAMSIIVETAYMEEAERFDWLIAMNAGRVPATGTPAQLRAQTGARTLEDAFIALLPEQRRSGRRKLHIPPRSIIGNEPVIVARVRRLHRRRPRQLHDRTRRDFRLCRLEWMRQDHDNEDADRVIAGQRGRSAAIRHPIDASDLKSRNRVGYMSQSFSLYTELTVRQNLDLHARLFHLPVRKARARITELIDRFGRTDYVDQRALDPPLGIRQRLSLAVAVVHEPEMLILDEPTSGVDPLARDRF